MHRANVVHHNLRPVELRADELLVEESEGYGVHAVYRFRVVCYFSANILFFLEFWQYDRISSKIIGSIMKSYKKVALDG